MTFQALVRRPSCRTRIWMTTASPLRTHRRTQKSEQSVLGSRSIDNDGGVLWFHGPRIKSAVMLTSGPARQRQSTACLSRRHAFTWITRQMRINLVTPFTEKDAVKALGARWDSAKKLWYIARRRRPHAVHAVDSR